jgi:hypothetical protein
VSNSNQDPLTNKNLEELEDVFAGAFGEFTGVEGLSIGAFGYHRIYGESLRVDDDDTAQVAGLFVGLPGVADWFTLYGEFVLPDTVPANQIRRRG